MSETTYKWKCGTCGDEVEATGTSGLMWLDTCMRIHGMRHGYLPAADEDAAPAPSSPAA